MHQLIPPSPAQETHRHLALTIAMPGGGEFEPCLAWVRNFNKCQVFQAEYKCYILKYGGVSGKYW